jgi:hypothetical protein
VILYLNWNNNRIACFARRSNFAVATSNKQPTTSRTVDMIDLFIIRRTIIANIRPRWLNVYVLSSPPADSVLISQILVSFSQRVTMTHFTTRAHKIAVRAALTELRRRRWREVPLPEMEMNEDVDTSYRELPDGQAGPEDQVDRNDMLKRVNRIIMEELTEKQRKALMQ